MNRELKVRDITHLSFRLEGVNPFDVPPAEWWDRAFNVRLSLESVYDNEEDQS